MPRIERIRRDTPGDLDAFRAIVREYEDSLDRDLRIPDLEGELRELAERYPEPSSALLLARDGDAAVGCVVVRALDGRTAEIKRLYVRPVARGTGLGRALVEEAIGFARERGHDRVVLDTHRDRLNEAFGLYRSFGFQECAPYAEPEYDSPTYMELSLR